MTIDLAEEILTNYHLTLEYVGYDTLPFLPGWSHYEAFKHSPSLFEHHKKAYARHIERKAA